MNHLPFGLLLRAELGRLLRIFREEGIPTVVLKGAPLALRLGTSLAARPQCDNDLLVRRRDVARTAALLTALGYTRHRLPRLETLLETDFQVALRREVEGVPLTVDLHWSPFFPPQHDVPEELVWLHTDRLQMDRTEVLVLDRALTLLHLAAHYEQHAFCEPRILQDLARAWSLWSADVDQGGLRKLATETGLQHAFEFALSTAESLDWVTCPCPRWGSLRAARVRRLLPPEVLARATRLGDYRRTFAAMLLLDPARLPRVLAREAFPHPERLAAMTGDPVSMRTYARYFTRLAGFVVRAIRPDRT